MVERMELWLIMDRLNGISFVGPEPPGSAPLLTAEGFVSPSLCCPFSGCLMLLILF